MNTKGENQAGELLSKQLLMSLFSVQNNFGRINVVLVYMYMYQLYNKHFISDSSDSAGILNNFAQNTIPKSKLVTFGLLNGTVRFGFQCALCRNNNLHDIVLKMLPRCMYVARNNLFYSSLDKAAMSNQVQGVSRNLSHF